MRETAPAAELVRLDAIRRIAPVQRLVRALELSESVRAIAISRLKELHAGRTELELMELLRGPSLAPQPTDESAA
jgi:hypothetical protein